MVTNIDFESVYPKTKNNFFHQRTIEFVNSLDLNNRN